MPQWLGDVKWFPAEIRRLILAVKKYDSLYNPRNEAFSVREAQSRTWRMVATLVGGGKTDTQCREKWNCLRGTYRRHVRTESTNNVKRRSGWPWADMLGFLKGYVLDRHDLIESIRQSTSPAASTPPPQNPVVVPTQHTSVCPMPTVKVTTANMLSGTSGLTLAKGIYPGGIILNTNSVGIGLVPNPPGISTQANVGIGIVQPNQTNFCIVQPNKPNIEIGLKPPKTTNVTVAVTKPITQVETDPIEVDLKKVKDDPDAPTSPNKTEFVDMDVAVKKEPIEENELHLSEGFSFLPEDSSQCLVEEIEVQSIQDSDGHYDVESNKDANSRPNDQGKNEHNIDLSQDRCDSNELFMRSTVAHMKRFSPYHQSVFKLKVQQLLHDMMFPQEARQACDVQT